MGAAERKRICLFAAGWLAEGLSSLVPYEVRKRNAWGRAASTPISLPILIQASVCLAPSQSSFASRAPPWSPGEETLSPEAPLLVCRAVGGSPGLRIVSGQNNPHPHPSLLLPHSSH